MLEPRRTRDGSNTLYSDQYKQTFHSIHGARTEAEHVFLSATGTRQRLMAGIDTRILEVGFGTGMNFFLTADLAQQHGAALSYWAFEQTLLPTEVMQHMAFETMLAHPKLFQAYVSWQSTLPVNPHPGLLRWRPDDSLTLTIIYGNAVDAPLPSCAVHGVYMDAFSPDQNAELWTVSFFEKLRSALVPGGSLATYSAKSSVRKNMLAAGFQTSKAPGPPGKREMLIGIHPSSP